MAQFKTGDLIHDARLGDVTVMEAHDASENSPEQYTVLTAGGEVVRTVLQVQGVHPASAPSDEVAAETTAEAPQAASAADVPDPNEPA